MVVSGYAAFAVLLLLSAASFFFSLAESALFSLGKWRVQDLADRRGGAARRVLALLQNPQDVLAAIVLGSTFANAGLVAWVLWLLLHAERPVLLPLSLLFLIILLCCEVIPKTLGVRAPEFWSIRLATPVSWLVQASRPLREIAQQLNTNLLRLVVPKMRQPHAEISDEEYNELLEMAYQQGALGHSEKEIISQIIRLDRRTASDVMKARAQIYAISDDLSVEEMREAARKFKHTRLPIYDGTVDTIVGILNTRAFLLDPTIDLSDAVEFPSFVPATMNLLQLMKALQRQQRGMAIVLDEFGGTAGVVTMEDILEELVGRFRGELEENEQIIERLAPGRWRLSGTTRIDDFKREYPALVEIEDCDTIGGLLLRQFEIVPAQGQSTTFHGVKFTASKVTDRQVTEVLVEVPKKGS
jgi:putative hemolysin